MTDEAVAKVATERHKRWLKERGRVIDMLKQIDEEFDADMREMGVRIAHEPVVVLEKSKDRNNSEIIRVPT